MIKQIKGKEYVKTYITERFDAIDEGNNYFSTMDKVFTFIIEQKIKVLYTIIYLDHRGFEKLSSNAHTRLSLELLQPVMYLCGKSCKGSQFTGIKVVGISQVRDQENFSFKKVIFDKKVIGTYFEAGADKEIYLCGLCGCGESFEEQISGLYENMERIVSEYGFRSTDIYRTYFYLRNLLNNYEQFNINRDKFFKKIYFGKVDYPASTCIQGHSFYNDDVTAIIMASSTNYTRICTEKQCEAKEYSKSFSRGVSIENGDIKREYISGTASIDEVGNTVYKNDIEAQLRQTMECIKELLDNRKLEICDIVSANIYLKEPKYLDEFQKICCEYGMDKVPFIVMIADVCRDDLLCEIDAIVEKQNVNVL